MPHPKRRTRDQHHLVAALMREARAKKLAARRAARLEDTATNFQELVAEHGFFPHREKRGRAYNPRCWRSGNIVKHMYMSA